MGWDPYFGAFYSSPTFTEQNYREMADAMKTNGMYEAGYRLIQVTDCWWVGWTNNVPVADPTKFPNGIKPLYDHLHSLGMEAGMYMMGGGWGSGICRRTGALGNETNAANAFAAWGVDWLMWDVTSLYGPWNWSNSIITMANALKSCGRPMVFKSGHGTFDTVYPWAMNLCRYDLDLNYRWTDITRVIDNILFFRTNVTQGFFLDPDDLFIGVDTFWFMGTNSLTPIEWNSQFAMWCMFSAPLMLNCDLRGAQTNSWFTTITNADLIAIDQDAHAVCADRISQTPGLGGNLEVWSKPLADGGRAIALFNRSSIAAEMSVTWDGPANVRDCWAQRNLGTFDSGFSTNVPSHGVALVKITEPGVLLLQPALISEPPSASFPLRFVFNAILEVGTAYRIDSSSDLVNWIPLTNFLSYSDQFTFSEPFMSNAPARYYRIVSRPAASKL